MTAHIPTKGHKTIGDAFPLGITIDFGSERVAGITYSLDGLNTFLADAAMTHSEFPADVALEFPDITGGYTADCDHALVTFAPVMVEEWLTATCPCEDDHKA